MIESVLILMMLTKLSQSLQCELKEDYSFGTDFYNQLFVPSTGFIGPIKSCEFICNDDPQCAGFALLNTYKSCTLYSRKGVEEGSRKKGENVYLCQKNKTQVCMDNEGRLIKEGESFFDGCNTCSCGSGGSLACTEKACLPSSCKKDRDCDQEEVCNSGSCVHACSFVKCNSDTECVVRNHVPSCEKKTSVCKRNRDCSNRETCQSGSCVSPCIFTKCGLNSQGEITECVVRNHRSFCEKVPSACKRNRDCPLDETCRSGSCTNPCTFTTCLADARCVVRNHEASCQRLKLW